MYFHKWLKLTVGFTMLLIVIRIAVSNSLNYIFLPWNVCLAFIPYWISNNKLKITKHQNLLLNTANKLSGLFWFCSWLLFLPNAPYIVTDLIHLQERAPIPFYFDIVIVFMSALSGLVLFFVSVSKAEKWWLHFFPTYNVYWFYSLAFGLCSFGIYLGRFGRFNSWNIITKPQLLIQAILDRFIFPFEHPRTWAVTLLFSAMLFLFYQLFKNVDSHTKENTSLKTLTNENTIN